MSAYDFTKLEKFLKRLGCSRCSLLLLVELAEGVQKRMTRHAFLNSKATKLPRRAGIIRQRRDGRLDLTRKGWSLIKIPEGT